jgi:hypothetical protein
MAETVEYAWLPDRESLNKQASAPIESLLGCAAWGCSFLLTNGRALKVTSDDDEVSAINFFLKERVEGTLFSGIVDIFTAPRQIAKFPWKDKTRSSIYAYEREIVSPIMDPEEARFDFGLPKRPRSVRMYGDAPDRQWDAIRMLNQIGVDIIQNRTNPFLNRSKARRKKIEIGLIDEYDHWLATLAEDVIDPKVKVNLLPIVESLQIVDQEGLILHDVGPSNMGFTASGVLKLYDFELIEF